jgi:spermidine synthase
VGRGTPRRSRSGAGVRVETPYAVAQVSVDRANPSGRLLTLDGLDCSYVDLDDPRHLAFGYVRRMADAIDLALPPGPVDAVHLGGGGCTLPRYVAATRAGSRQEVFEHDEALLALAREHLGLRTSARLRVRIGDAGALLARRPAASVDLVAGDAFAGLDAVTATTAQVRRVLRPGGLYVLNVIDAGALARARTQARALAAAFAHAVALAPGDVVRGRRQGNVVLAGSAVPLPLEALRARAAAGAEPVRVVFPASGL